MQERHEDRNKVKRRLAYNQVRKTRTHLALKESPISLPKEMAYPRISPKLQYQLNVYWATSQRALECTSFSIPGLLASDIHIQQIGCVDLVPSPFLDIGADRIWIAGFIGPGE